MSKIEPAELSLSFALPASGNRFIDFAQCLSAVNRRLYSQGKEYYCSRVMLTNVGSENSVAVGLGTIHDTWVTANAHTKAKALWNKMRNRILDDSPSVNAKYSDFKVYMSDTHRTAISAGTANLIPEDFRGGQISFNEWDYATMILPQHDVVQATGVVKDPDEFDVHMLGDDIGGPLPAALVSGGIIKMYGETRARIQGEPVVPTEFPDSWGTRLTDDGSQDPELAEIVDTENDTAPYALESYVGGETNFVAPSLQGKLVTTTANTAVEQLGFKIPLGLMEISVTGNSDEEAYLTFFMTPGMYKGVLTTEVEQ